MKRAISIEIAEDVARAAIVIAEQHGVSSTAEIKRCILRTYNIFKEQLKMEELKNGTI